MRLWSAQGKAVWGLRMPCHQAVGWHRALLSCQQQPSIPAAALPLVTGEVSIRDSATQCGSGQGVGDGEALPQH